MICVEIQPLNAEPYLVLSSYRPPSDTVENFDKFEEVLHFVEAEAKEVLIIGDTNCDITLLQKEQKDSNVPVLNNVKCINELYCSYGLTQLISDPTRETATLSTIIDHIVVSNVMKIIESGVHRVALSDQYLVYAVRKFRGAVKNNHKIIKTRQLKNYNEVLFLMDLASVDWRQPITADLDIDENVARWINKLRTIIEKHAPLMLHRVSEKLCPWITSDLKDLQKTRDKLKIAAVKAKFELLMQAYRKVRNKVNSLNTRLKRQYFTNTIDSCEGNLIETWATINKLINKKSKTTSISAVKSGDSIITDPQGIADSMNKFFCSIGEKLSKEIADTSNVFSKQCLC